MKKAVYPKLALESIRKNKRLYIPYILTCVGMVMMYYIVLFLEYTDTLSYMAGARTVQTMLAFGGWVIAVFSVIFLFYTNSFLIRRRKKEFGLYYVLGMGKRNIAKILFWETAIIAGISLVVGLLAGIVFSKLAELGFVNLLQEKVQYTLSICPMAVAWSVSVFGWIFVLLFLNAARQVGMSSAVSLLRSENVGEKAPKANGLFGAAGVVILVVAYVLSLSIKAPVSALLWFFVAVIMVIIATYLIFISGSVLLCRLLQKNKRYYYKANHFVSVSSMAYRMKRNGAGLASVCILATMVLVTLSSTVSLYFGAGAALNNRYPHQFNLMGYMRDAPLIDTAKAVIDLEFQKNGVQAEIHQDYRCASITGKLEGSSVETDVRKVSAADMALLGSVMNFCFIPLEDYNRTAHSAKTLQEGEALLYMMKGEYLEDTLTFLDGETFRIKEKLQEFPVTGESVAIVVPTVYLVVSDFETALGKLLTLADFNGDRSIVFRWYYGFDVDLSAEKQVDLYATIQDELRAATDEEMMVFYLECREVERRGFLDTFGALLFLGLILSMVFIIAAVLIVYYKQISEGYEDQSRFEIMQKVGMTKREIRKSINSQLLTVFFLPLLFAGCHLLFAFPIIRKLLILFESNNVALFALTTIVSFLVFALFYTVVYRMTSNAYYRIVSGAKAEGNEA